MQWGRRDEGARIGFVPLRKDMTEPIFTLCFVDLNADKEKQLVRALS